MHVHRLHLGQTADLLGSSTNARKVAERCEPTPPSNVMQTRVPITLLSLLLLVLPPLAAPACAEATSPAPAPHVCLIGAGIASATIAHYLTTPTSTNATITVFERSNRPGGRLETVYLSTGAKPVEIPVEAGASIIADDNHLMAYFASLLNLSRKQPLDAPLGLWNGKGFTLRLGNNAFVDIVTVLTRYHTSLFRQRRLVSSLLKRFGTLYPAFLNPASHLEAWRPHGTVASLLNHTGLYSLTQTSFTASLSTFSKRHTEELVAAVTRVNYGQDPWQMNALSGAVALAGSGTALWAVRKGHAHVVQLLLERAAVRLHLDTPVTTVERALAPATGYVLRTADAEWHCDAVVLAAPFELANLELPPDMAARADVGRSFQRTYATFVRGVLNNHTFGAGPPDQILTLAESGENFTSVGLAWRGEGTVPSIYKIFSHEELSSTSLSRIFLPGVEKLAEYPWFAYPKFNPPEKFAPFDLDPSGAFFYTSPLESAGSAMEMSAISGANAAALIRQRLGLEAEQAGADDAKEEL